MISFFNLTLQSSREAEISILEFHSPALQVAIEKGNFFFKNKKQITQKHSSARQQTTADQ